jgi:glutamyl-tRNA synthetase
VDHERLHVRAVERGTEGGDLFVGIRPRLPRPRVLVEDLHGGAAALHAALDGLGRTARRTDVRADQHRPPVLAPISIRAPCACASLLRRPAPSTSAGRGRHSTTGCWPARGGTGLLRIEDTDRERSTPRTSTRSSRAPSGSSRLRRQPVNSRSARERHAEVVEQLLAGGHAYRSTAGADRSGLQGATRNRGFRGEDEGGRLAADPDEGAPRASTSSARDDLREPPAATIWSTPGRRTPDYHLAVVVDDLDAADHARGARRRPLSNTPKQQLILEALGIEPPVYAHVPLLHGPDGKKLSKRHGAASVQELRDAATCPAAVRNYLALLGWGYDESTEFFTTEELQRNFALERVSKSPAVFDEQKLRHMNGRYLRELSLDELTQRLEALTGRTGLRSAAAISQEKMSTLAEFWPLAQSFFDGPVDDPKARDKVLGKAGAAESLSAAAEALDGLTGAVDSDSVEAALAPVVERLGVKPGAVYQPLRVALTGTTISPGIFETVAVLGRSEALSRLEQVQRTVHAGR